MRNYLSQKSSLEIGYESHISPIKVLRFCSVGFIFYQRLGSDNLQFYKNSSMFNNKICCKLINSSNMGKVVINNYTILLDQELGSGNFATVYKAIDNKTRQVYAAKLLSKVQIDMDQNRKQSFEEELVAMQTKSEHIVKFVEMFEDKEHYYIIQQLCDENLREYLKKATWLSEDKALRFLIEICIGIKALVRRNITHRDLKPENILLKQGRIKIADFGVSKKNLHNKCCIEIPAGSLTYMSMQALKGQKYTSKADIWTIGLIFYELIHGECPWYRQGDNHRSLINKIQTQKVRAKSQLASTTKSFLKQCLQVQQHNRLDWPQFFSHPIFKGLFSDYTQERKGMQKKMSNILADLGNRIVNKQPKFIQNFGAFLSNKSELSLPQFQNLLKWLDPTLNKHEIQYIFQESDMNQDGSVALDQLSNKIDTYSQNHIQSPRKVKTKSSADSLRSSSNSQILSRYKKDKMEQMAKNDKFKAALRKIHNIITLKGQTMENVYRRMATEGMKMNKEAFSLFIKKFCPDFPDEQILDLFNLLACNLGNAGFVQFVGFNSIYEKAINNDIQEPRLVKKDSASIVSNSFHTLKNNDRLSSSCKLIIKEDFLYMSCHQIDPSTSSNIGNIKTFFDGFNWWNSSKQEQSRRSMLKDNNIGSGVSTQNSSSVMKKNLKAKTSRVKTSIIFGEQQDQWAV